MKRNVAGISIVRFADVCEPCEGPGCRVQTNQVVDVDGLERWACSGRCALRIRESMRRHQQLTGCVVFEAVSMITGGLVVALVIVVGRILADVWEVIKRG